MAEKKKRHLGWIAIPIILILLVLPVIVAYVYRNRHSFDVASVRENQVDAVQRAEDRFDFGSVNVSYSPARVYELVDKAILGEELRETFRGTVTLEDYAIEPHAGLCVVYAKLNVLGFLPLTLRAEADITAQNGDIGVWIESVNLGTKLTLPPDKLGSNRAFSLSASAPVINVDTSEDGITVAYRFLQDRLPDSLPPDSSLISDYCLFCPEKAAEDPVVSLWNEKGSLSRSLLCQTVTDRDSLLKLFVLAEDEAVSTFFAGLTDFERETLFPAERKTVSLSKEGYRSAVQEAYTGLERTLEDVIAFSADKQYYLSGGTVLLRARRYFESTPIDISDVTDGCSLINPAESRFVLLYAASAPVPPQTREADRFDTLEAKEFDLKDALMRSRATRFAPGLVTRFAGSMPCLLYRGTDGSTVISELDEESYTTLVVKSSLILLDDYQRDAGTVTPAPVGMEGIPSYRLIAR